VSVERIGSRVEKCAFQDADGEAFTISATFGVAGVTEERHTEREILVATDQALYQGKASGGGRIVMRKD